MNEVIKIEYRDGFIYRVVFDDGKNGADVVPETLYEKITAI